MAEANQVLLDSLVAQSSAGPLIVGRGVPAAWLGTGDVVSVDDFPTVGGRRVNLRISSSDDAMSLSLSGGPRPGPVLFELPAFADDVAEASAGTVDEADGNVTLAPSESSVLVRLRHPAA